MDKIRSVILSPHEKMVTRVAQALGQEMASQVAFVGGCATALLVTDEYIRSQVRFTDDVDLIVQVIGYGQWHQLEIELEKRGFRSSGEDEVICRKRLRDAENGELIVDFMPDDEKILGFSNRWYTEALASAEELTLSNGVSVRVVSGPYFLATKLEAYKGRGKGDPMGSRDVEDILNLVEGRDALMREVRESSEELRAGISAEITALMDTRDFDYAVASTCRGEKGRETRLFEKLEILARI